MAGSRTLRLALALVTSFVAIVLFRPINPELRLVFAPLAASLIVALVSAALLFNRRDAQLDEIGVWYIGALTVYAALPLLAALLIGLQYTVLNDSRLFLIQPTAQDVAAVGWLYVCYMSAFAAAYVFVRGKPAARSPASVILNRPTRLTIGTLWLVVSALLLLTMVLFGRSADGYADQYLRISQLPLGLRQLIKMLDGVRVVLTLFLLTLLFSNYRRTKWLIAALVGWQLISTVTAGGSRTELMITMAACTLLYHRFVRPVRARTALLGGTAGVILFLGLGIARSLQGVEETGPFTVGVSVGEFEALFANALDLRDRRVRGEVGRSVAVGFSDLAGPIPSQLLPFKKQDASVWYLTTFYPEIADRGGGMAFGVISQAIMGLGALGALLRGMMVGVMFALLHRYYRSHSNDFWAVAFNCWLIVWSYQTFRASTFYLLTPLVQSFLPTVLLVVIGRNVVAGAARVRPAPAMKLGGSY